MLLRLLLLPLLPLLLVAVNEALALEAEYVEKSENNVY